LNVVEAKTCKNRYQIGSGQTRFVFTVSPTNYGIKQRNVVYKKKYPKKEIIER